MSRSQSVVSDTLGQSELGPNNSVSIAIFGQALIAQADNWRAAYRITLLNAGIFLFLALAMFALEPRSLVVILSAPALFFFGGMLSFFLMVRSGGDLAAISWFVLGASVYFGMGAVAGGLHVHPYSDFLFADDTSYLIRVNLLNACSVFIVLATAYPLANMGRMKVSQYDMQQENIERLLRNIFPYIVGISAIGVGLKYALFPVAESLVIRSMAAKAYLIIPSCFLLLGLLRHSIGWQLKLLAYSIFLLEILNGLICFTKYQIILVTMALIIGMWIGVAKRSAIFLVMSFMIVSSVFAIINPIVSLGRSHIDYDPYNNTVETRLKILTDAGYAFYLDKGSQEDVDSGNGVRPQKFKSNYSEIFTGDIAEMSTLEARMKAVGRRFDVVSIQGYLINEYNSGRRGHTLADFWATMVPRVFWPGKPIMTRFGVELNSQYYFRAGHSGHNISSTAPTFSAEAYWNYGVSGVLIISVLLGLVAGWLTRCWQYAMVGRDPAFFLIAFPVAIWVSFVESWVVATYLGEFIIFVVILLFARAFFALMRTLRKRARS